LPSSRRRNAPIGVSRSAGRVARSRTVSAVAESRFAWPRLIGSALVIAGLENQERPIVSGTKGRAFRGATLIRRCRTLVTGGRGGRPRLADRPWRSALPCIAGALRRSLLGDPCRPVRSGGSRVHSPPPSPRFPPATGSLCRRSTGTRPVHSPLFVMSAEYVSGSGERQARGMLEAGRGGTGTGEPGRSCVRGTLWPLETGSVARVVPGDALTLETGDSDPGSRHNVLPTQLLPFRRIGRRLVPGAAQDR
jgi:hypothetical protein